MLKGVPSIISPDLLKALAEMGHGDEIVLVDANFPAASNAKRLIRLDGVAMPELLQAVLQLIPLDPYVATPAVLMQVVDGDLPPAIWETYRRVIEAEAGGVVVSHIARADFYERSRAAYAVVATGEQSPYGNIVLKKGVVS
ncbi:L-fucose mutarotase [Collinsella sp. AGMB00827]|uniref:L-fucose mutarotase n=1 Tax=Collinsella ureilytica TaxID=2869515 RepID=A0ABS7MKI8_9ACTN|nr:L-fucose mutarotase [Collinsella urealyticum]MBY4796910.1 L-fucose mutarotase [Collinsella urealyticum]